MNEIICPHCNKAFQVDKKGYADILKQVYDKEFESKLNERLLQIEKDKTIEIKIEKKEAERKLQLVETEKNKIIDELKFSIQQANSVKQLAVSEAVNKVFPSSETQHA